MSKMTKYFRGVNEEARRIRWPDRKTLWKAVAVVLVITIISALVMYFSDFIASQIMKAFDLVFPKSSNSDSTSTSEAIAMLVNLIK